MECVFNHAVLVSFSLRYPGCVEPFVGLPSEWLESHAGARRCCAPNYVWARSRATIFRAMHDRLDGGDQSGHIPRQADEDISTSVLAYLGQIGVFVSARYLPSIRNGCGSTRWLEHGAPAWSPIRGDAAHLQVGLPGGMAIRNANHLGRTWARPRQARPVPRQLRVLLKARFGFYANRKYLVFAGHSAGRSPAAARSIGGATM